MSLRVPAKAESARTVAQRFCWQGCFPLFLCCCAVFGTCAGPGRGQERGKEGGRASGLAHLMHCLPLRVELSRM